MPGSTAPPSRPRVLLIDDSEIASQMVCAALEGSGFEVRAAGSLGEFTRVLASWSPHIVLADVHMPGLSGPDLCQWIKQRVETQTVPVVLYSDMPESDLEALARQAGAEAYVSKENGLARVADRLSELCAEIIW